MSAPFSLPVRERASLAQRLAENHGRRGRQIERPSARRQRNRQPDIGLGVDEIRHPGALSAEQQTIVRPEGTVV